MDWGYPLDINDLLSRAQRCCGKAFLKHVESLPREDEKLSAFAWEAGRGWFPTLEDRTTPHSGLDIGLPDTGDHGLWRAQVYSIAEGEVFYADSYIQIASDAEFGRVIVRHPTPQGDVYALYMQLGSVSTYAGAKVKKGDALGTIGWHDKFHHLKFALASKHRIGGTDLEPEIKSGNWPQGDDLWSVLRVETDTLELTQWPGMMVLGGPWYLHQPIEFVRLMRGETAKHYIGAGSPHEFHGEPTTVAGNATIELLRYPKFKGVPRLEKLAHSSGEASDPDARPLKQFVAKEKAHEQKAPVAALQHALMLVRPYKLATAFWGVFGPGTADALRKFQANEMKAMKEMLAHWDISASEIAETGELDRLTLLALDAWVAAKLGIKPAKASAQEPAKAAAPKPPEESPNESREEAPKDGESQSMEFSDEDASAGAGSGAVAEAIAAPPEADLATGQSKDKEWVFETRKTKRKQSLKFGLKLYKALLSWELLDENGEEMAKPEVCRYSCLDSKNKPYKEKYAELFAGNTPPIAEEAYFKIAKDKDGNPGKDEASRSPVYFQWPRIDLTHKDIASTSTIGKHKVYTAGTVKWIATGNANCCISQYAAFYAAAGGVRVSAMTDNPKPRADYYFNKSDDNPARKFTELKKNKAGEIESQKPIPATVAFEKAVMLGASAILDEAGKPVEEFYTMPADGAACGGGVNAMRILGIGDGLGDGRYSSGQETHLLVRLGDWANNYHHAFLVGDIVYGIWLDGPQAGKVKPKPMYGKWAKKSALKDWPDLFVAQSSFALKEPLADGRVHRLTVPEIEGFLERGKNDEVFMDRVQKFIDGCKAGKYQGKPIKRMEVVDICIFSANGLNGTVFGKHYHPDTGKEDSANNNDRLHRGITRAWRGGVPDDLLKEKVPDPADPKNKKKYKESGRTAGPGASYGRWYGPVEA